MATKERKLKIAENAKVNNATQRTISIIGGKGAGKTTLIKMLLDQEKSVLCLDPLNVINGDIEAYRIPLKKEDTEEKLKKGWEEMPQWVFVTDKGTPLIEGHWRERVFNKALEKAKLRKIRIHDLRHGFATQLIQSGESLAYVKDLLGHHSIKVTVDIYGHLVPGANKSAVDKLDDEAPKGTLWAPKTEKGSAYAG